MLREKEAESQRKAEVLANEVERLKREQSKGSTKSEEERNGQLIYIAELKSRISDLERASEAKQREIENLRALADDCDLHVKFAIVAPEDETAATGEEESRRAQVETLAKEREVREEGLRTKHLAEIYERDLKIKELEYAIKRLNELRQEQETNTDQVSEPNVKEYEREVSELQKSLEIAEQKRVDMREEIAVLIDQCKEVHGQLKAKDGQVKKQAVALQQFETILQEKDAEILKREQLLNRMSKQLEEKKDQLNMADVKLKQMSKSVVKGLNIHLSQKEKEVTTLKGTIRSLRLSLQGANKDVLRLRQEVERLQKAKKARDEFIDTFSDKKDAAEAKHLKQLNTSDKEEDVTPPKGYPEMHESVVLRKDGTFPTLAPHTLDGNAEETKEKRRLKRMPKCSESYLRRVEKYSEAIAEAGFHNNSKNMLGILAQDFERERGEYRVKDHDEAASPLRPRKKLNYDVKIDVNDIIRKSLSNKAAAAGPSQLRIGNFQKNVMSPVVRRLKMRNNSKA